VFRNENILVRRFTPQCEFIIRRGSAANNRRRAISLRHKKRKRQSLNFYVAHPSPK
jgi:hypothetical protein